MRQRNTVPPATKVYRCQNKFARNVKK